MSSNLFTLFNFLERNSRAFFSHLKISKFLFFQFSAEKLILSDEKSGDQIKDDRFLFQIFAELFLFGSNFILILFYLK